MILPFDQQDFVKITEATSLYDNLEKMSAAEILHNINQEDQKVSLAVAKALPQIEAFMTAALPKFLTGGRLFYIGAGTSGRLGVLDASECPPTYGVSPDTVIGIIAGGDFALRHPVEKAEDDENQGWNDLMVYNISNDDVLVGIAASGTTPYVIGALQKAKSLGIVTGCITCNQNSPLASITAHPIEVVVGPEFVTGSTRMKAGTAQKLVLNTISTTMMIKLGRVKGNKMVDMQLTNTKIVNRGIIMLMNELGVSEKKATDLLKKYQSVRKAIQSFKN